MFALKRVSCPNYTGLQRWEKRKRARKWHSYALRKFRREKGRGEENCSKFKNKVCFGVRIDSLPHSEERGDHYCRVNWLVWRTPPPPSLTPTNERRPWRASINDIRKIFTPPHPPSQHSRNLPHCFSMNPLECRSHLWKLSWAEGNCTLWRLFWPLLSSGGLFFFSLCSDDYSGVGAF